MILMTHSTDYTAIDILHWSKIVHHFATILKSQVLKRCELKKSVH